MEVPQNPGATLIQAEGLNCWNLLQPNRLRNQKSIYLKKWTWARKRPATLPLTVIYINDKTEGSIGAALEAPRPPADLLCPKQDPVFGLKLEVSVAKPFPRVIRREGDTQPQCRCGGRTSSANYCCQHSFLKLGLNIEGLFEEQRFHLIILKNKYVVPYPQ